MNVFELISRHLITLGSLHLETDVDYSTPSRKLSLPTFLHPAQHTLSIEMSFASRWISVPVHVWDLPSLVHLRIRVAQANQDPAPLGRLLSQAVRLHIQPFSPLP